MSNDPPPVKATLGFSKERHKGVQTSAQSFKDWLFWISITLIQGRDGFAFGYVGSASRILLPLQRPWHSEPSGAW